MSQSPWAQGDTREAWKFLLEPDTGDLDITSLTASNFAYFQRNISSGVERQGDGAFSNLIAATGGNPAQITYQETTNDVANPGMYHQRIKVAQGSASQTFDFGVLSIEPT